MSNCRNTDFYSFHVIPLNKTISNYFEVYSLTQNLATGLIKYVLVIFMIANMYQIWLHLSCWNVNFKVF